MSRPGFPKTEYGNEHAHYVWDTLPPTFPASFPTDVTGLPYHTVSADSVGSNTSGYPQVKGNNGYTGYRYKGKATPASWKGTVGTPPYLQGGGNYPFVNILGADPIVRFNASYLEGQCREAVIPKLQSKIKSQKINVGVAVAEFKKTCGTVTSAAQRIASAIRSVKRGDIGTASNTLLGGRHKNGRGTGGRDGRNSKPKSHTPPNSGSVSKDWLALQYGWVPLLSDVYGATEELARTLTYRPIEGSVSYRCGRQDQKIFETISTGNFPSTRGVLKFSTTAQGVIKYRVSNQMAQLAANTGVVNPLAIAWELIPYSFVVDWFLPVGTYLNNLDYDLGLEFSRGWITYKSSVSGTHRVVPGPYSGGGADQIWSSGSHSGEVTSFVREVLNEFPAVPHPEFKDPLSLKHVANALALLRVAFK